MSGKVIHVLSGAPYDLYIGRAMPRYGLTESPYANPFKVGKHGDLVTALARYEDHQREIFEEYPSALVNVQEMIRRGITLACWCAPRDGTPLKPGDEEICHGQVLLRLAKELA